MKNLIILFVFTSCALQLPTQDNRNKRKSHVEKAKSCVTEIMERFGESSKEARETCLMIYRRKR